MSRPPTERELLRLANTIMAILDRVPAPVFITSNDILIWQNTQEA